MKDLAIVVFALATALVVCKSERLKKGIQTLNSCKGKYDDGKHLGAIHC